MLIYHFVYTTYMAVASFIYPMKSIVGHFGCYFIDFLEIYGVGFMRTQSFYVALFRYICIVQTDLMLKLGSSPEVRAWKHFWPIAIFDNDRPK